MKRFRVEVVLGIDVGTQGVRVLAVDASGQVVAAAHEPLASRAIEEPPGWFEQSPQAWWQAVARTLRSLRAGLPAGTRISGASVDSTSGTVLPVNRAGEPLHPALMYNDRRAEPQVQAVRSAGAAYQEKLGYLFGSSYALPKILWLKENRPEVFVKTYRFLHAADYIAGKLTGCYDFSDASNALKTGYDLVDLRWPGFIEEKLGIPLDRLPQVVLPGEPVGQVCAQAADETGLPAGLAIFAGATDGTAAQIGSGAAQPGEWNSTLGTTLVLKGISRRLVPDPLGRIYFHRYPEGKGKNCWWMPGGASNTGAEWIARDHPGQDPGELDRLAYPSLPTRLARYPLARRGERFPFVHPGAEGFLLGEPSSPLERYAAGLEGLAYVERLAYETLQSIGLETGGRLFITGGGSRSAIWSQVRASVLHRPLERPAVTDTAMGAAILAASGCWYASLSEAVRQMVRVAQTILPNPAWEPVYEEGYARFLGELKRRGMI